MGGRAGIVMRALLLACAFAWSPTAARADTVVAPGAADELRLAAGQTIAYPQTLYRHGERYVGGVTYVVVDASLDELTALLADPTAYRQVLPHARDARVLGYEGEDRLVEITQGTALVQAAYTLRMRTDDDKRRVRFWLDRSKPHGIDDAWGFFRVDPLPSAADGSPRTLVAYGILVDLGPGLIRDIFEARIQASLLTVPQRLREYASLRFRGRPRA
jgi:hypothetical protein